MQTANILISYFSEMGETMYDAITDVLLKNGNNVFRLNINNSSVRAPVWGEDSKMVDDPLLKQIVQFEPEIILDFSNCLPTNVRSAIGTDCRHCIIDGDSVNYIWNRKDLMETKENRLYLGQQSASKGMYEEFLGMELDDEHYLYFPGATVIQRKPEVQDKNISFIGTNFHLMYSPLEGQFYTEDALSIYEKIRGDFFYDVSKLKEEYPNIENMDEFAETIRTALAGQERIKYLQSVCDLGLTIYGVRWENSAYIDMELARCFDKTSIRTLEENQYVYNSSKISINISHPQALTSFSWRVMDIMASASCLTTEMKKDWIDLFGDYMSDETKEYVVYKDRFDLRAKSIKLLEDDDLREHCVTDLNRAIEENGRWETRFRSLEKHIGCKIVGNSNDDPEYTWIHADDSRNRRKKENYISRLLHNGMYRISHVPKIRYYLWDILRP